MDYQETLFAQYTPYLQWLKEQRPGAEQQDNDTELGKRVCVLPFSSCMDPVGALADVQRIEEARIYIFANRGGRMAAHAPAQLAQAFARHADAVLVYTDEDYLGTLRMLYGIEEERFAASFLAGWRDEETGLYRGAPWFKPDFSPDTLRSFFYIGGLFALRGVVLRRVWRPQRSLYETVAAAVALCGQGRDRGVVHLPQVLFTNRRLAASRELPGRGALAPDTEPDTAKRLVSVIIPSKNNSSVLERCLRTLTACTTAVLYELIIVDNGSCDEEKRRLQRLFDALGTDRPALALTYLYEESPFNFSAMCNRGARAAKGEYLLFLNDDMEIVRPGWLHSMLGAACQAHVGAVGAKLWYPDGDTGGTGIHRLQHAGITNMGIGPAHKLSGMMDEGNLYHGHNIVTYNMLAVTGACLLVAREKFDLAGGFDEELAVAYNDVSLCFRLYELGFFNVVCNDAALFHHESLSRGQDTSPQKQKRLQQELDRLYKKHPQLKGRDPFYSPNLVQWKKDVQYHTGYLYACDKPVQARRMDAGAVRALPRAHQNPYIRRLTGENLSMLSIDSVMSIDSIASVDDVVSVEGASADYISAREEPASGRLIVVTGWYVLRGHDNASVTKALLLRNINNMSDIYELPIHPLLREDVSELFRQETGKRATRNTELSGIQVIFNGGEIPAGSYEIGVLAKKNRSYIIWSGQTLTMNAVCEEERDES